MLSRRDYLHGLHQTLHPLLHQCGLVDLVGQVGQVGLAHLDLEVLVCQFQVVLVALEALEVLVVHVVPRYQHQVARVVQVDPRHK